MWQRAITGSSGGGGNIKSGDEGSITTANTELEINTGVSNLKRFVVQCNSGTSLYTITWDKNATINSGGTNYYGMVKFYQSISSSAGATQVVGTATTYGGIISINESTGKVTIKSAGASGHLPMSDIHWIAEGD